MPVINESANIPYDPAITYRNDTVGKKLSDLSSEIVSASIPDGSITAAKLASNSVATAKIVDANVTTPKLADDSVTLAKLVNATAQGKWLVRTSASGGDFQEADSSTLGRTLVAAADEAAAQAALALTPGTDVQAYSAKLAAVAALTWAADKGWYLTGTATLATYDQTAQGRALAGSGASRDLAATINLQTGTSYTIDVAGADTDNGVAVRCSNAAAIAVTLPATAPVGFYCSVYQGGAGQITFAAAGGGTLVNRQAHTKTAGQHAGVGLLVFANAGGSAAQWTLTGDTAA